LDDLVNGLAASFAEVANHEDRVERHASFLAALAFLLPRIISAIIDGNDRAIKTIRRTLSSVLLFPTNIELPRPTRMT